MNMHHFILLICLLFLTLVATCSSNAGANSSGLLIDTHVLKRWIGFDSVLEVGELRLSGKGIRAIDEKSFSGMLNLDLLDLSHNLIDNLPANVFNGLTKLERLSLYYNNLHHLDSYIFYGLHNLKYLDLERNELSNLAWNTFKGLTNLWYLDLDNNEIQNLDAQHIQDLKQLKYFFVKNNNISKIENGFIKNFNAICVQFLYFENNRCGVESYFDANNCKRINSTSCEVYEIERLTVKEKRHFAETEKELQVLRYQVRSYKELSKNDMLAISDFKNQLTDAKHTIQLLEFQLKNRKSHSETLTGQILTFSAKRQKDQEIINGLVSERDDVKFLNGYLQDELRLLKSHDWKLQEAQLENARLNKRVRQLTDQLNATKQDLSKLKTKRAENSRIMRSLVNEIESRRMCFNLNDYNPKNVDEVQS